MRTSVSSSAGRSSRKARRTASASPNSRTASAASRKAAASTKRTPRSSSTTQISSAMRLLQRQIQREHGFAGATGTAQLATMFMGDLARQGQAQPGAVGATGNQRLEQGIAQRGRYARTVVDHVHPQRHANHALAQAHAVFDARAQGERLRASLQRVARQVQQHLMQTIRIAQQIRHAGVVVLAQALAAATDKMLKEVREAKRRAWLA